MAKIPGFGSGSLAAGKGAMQADKRYRTDLLGGIRILILEYSAVDDKAGW